MKRMKPCLIAAAVAFLLFAGSVQAAHAQYGAVTIENPTGGTIYYQFKWGQNADWVTKSVGPGLSWTHYIELDANGLAPRPFIRFENGAGWYREYSLQFFAVNNNFQPGKPYSFAWSGGSLNLYSR
jgi:hypothetical protein